MNNLDLKNNASTNHQPSALIIENAAINGKSRSAIALLINLEEAEEINFDEITSWQPPQTKIILPKLNNNKDEEELEYIRSLVSSESLNAREQVKLFLDALNFRQQDRIYIRCIPAKKIPSEKLLEWGLGFETKESKNSKAENKKPIVVNKTIKGYIEWDDEEEDYSFYENRSNKEPEKHPWGIQKLQELNKKGYGIYFVVGQGGDNDGDISKVDTLFYECDGISKDEQWKKVEKLRRNNKLNPIAIVETRNSIHVYYRREDNNDFLARTFRGFQQRLIQLADSDQAIHNEARLMRLPGFNHVKYNDGILDFVPCVLKLCDFNAPHYSNDDFNEILPTWDEKRWSKKKKSNNSLDAHNVKNFSQSVANNGYYSDANNIKNFAPYLIAGEVRKGGIETYQCPAHDATSNNSLHIFPDGHFKPHCGCDTQKVWRAARDIAVANGYVLPQKKQWQQKETERQEGLHTLPTYENDINIDITGEYCADEISAIAPSYGNLFIKLPMGMGKTQAAKHLINIDYPNRPVVAIFPTTALGRSTCKDLGITYWQDIQDECKRENREYDLNKRLRECHRLGITYDSLWRIDDKNNKDLILIIDEGEKGYSHLLNSATVNKNRNRPFCIKALFNLGKNQDEQGVLTLVMDANLTSIAKDLTLSFLSSEVNVNVTTKRVFPKFPCKILTSLEKGKTGKLLATHTHNTFEAVRQGKFIIIPTDNKDDGIGIEKELRKEFKDISIWRFDSSNSGSDEGKQFAGNIDYFLAKNKVQVFIYSPSMGQGLSSTITKQYAEAVQRGATEEELTEVATLWKKLTPYFDEVYAYNYHLDNFEFQQMLGRYRLLVMRNIWVDSKVMYDGCSSTDPSVIVRNMRESRETAFTIESEAIKQLKDKAIEIDDLSIIEKEFELLKAIKEGNIPPYIWAMCRQQARRNWQIKNRRENLINWLTKCGHEVDSQPIETDNVNDRDRKKVDDAKKETNKEFAKLAIEAYDIQGLLTDSELEAWGQREHLDPVKEQPRYAISIFNRKYPEAIYEIGREDKTPEEYKELQRRKKNETNEERIEREEIEKCEKDKKIKKQIEFFDKTVATGKEFWLKAITNGWMYKHRNEIIKHDLQDNRQLQKAFNFCGIYSAKDFKRRTAVHSFISKLGLFDLIKFEEAELPKDDAPQYTWDSPAMKELAKRLMSKAGVKGCQMYFNKSALTDPEKVVNYANDLYNHFGYSLVLGKKNKTTRHYVLRYLDEKNFPEKYRKVIFQSLEFKNLEPLLDKKKVVAVDLFSSIELEKIYCHQKDEFLEDKQEPIQVVQNTQLELPLHVH